MKMKATGFPLILLSVVLLLNACKKDDDSIEVNTLEVTNIGSYSATLNGEVASNETPVTERGFFWSETNENPGETDNKIVVEGTTGSFSTELSDLEHSTTYFVRAYATNIQKTAYGQKVIFKTEVIEWQKDTQTDVVDVTSSITGYTWMDRNLGASRVATSITDTKAYGDLYQWGRSADGHEKRESPTTTTLSITDIPGHSSFITSSSSPWDWRSPQNDKLWQGVNGTNNPCPSGYRLPTEAEWEAEHQSWNSNNAEGAFASPLKLLMAGLRNFKTGLLLEVGSKGFYWSSTVKDNSLEGLSFDSNNAGKSVSVRSASYSVRCIKD